MKIAVGSVNEVKVQAVKESLEEYPFFAEAKITALSVPSGVADQPLSLSETIQGAKNRAQSAFQSCEGFKYAFGIESGLCEAPGSHTGFINICVCCIYNGVNHHIGFSTGFEVPLQILQLVKERKIDLNQASYLSGITTSQNIGSGEGLIGILTKGRVPRKQYTKECVYTALIQLDNSKWYGSK